MPGYASKIERLRLDMTHVVRYKRWQAGLDVNLRALRGLRQIQLCTHTDQGLDALGFRNRVRRAMLTKAVMELFAIRHCLTIIVIRNGHFDRRLDHESKIEKEFLENV